MKEFIALAKTRPGEINYASAGTSSVGDLATELFNRRAGIRTNAIPYKGNALALIDTVGGQVQLFFGAIGPMLPYVQHQPPARARRVEPATLAAAARRAGDRRDAARLRGGPVHRDGGAGGDAARDRGPHARRNREDHADAGDQDAAGRTRRRHCGQQLRPNSSRLFSRPSTPSGTGSSKKPASRLNRFLLPLQGEVGMGPRLSTALPRNAQGRDRIICDAN